MDLGAIENMKINEWSRSDDSYHVAFRLGQICKKGPNFQKSFSLLPHVRNKPNGYDIQKVLYHNWEMCGPCVRDSGPRARLIWPYQTCIKSLKIFFSTRSIELNVFYFKKYTFISWALYICRKSCMHFVCIINETVNIIKHWTLKACKPLTKSFQFFGPWS